MALAELNVRLGLIYKDLDRGLRTVERNLERSGRRLSSLGSDLTIAISAPLAALGASAIRQAGEMESLKLAMKSTFETAGRSAAEATAEVESLRKSALAPGLDFEQAIKGSIRLQGVGYAAEAARNTIEQVANAVALTGGTAQNLDSVTVQFSQMIAKGKVLAQDLRIIQENMPIISRLMQQAFGTQNAEALQKMGISGKEFVDRITAAAATLPRVEGGIKNAIVNAGAAARQSLAQLGEEINKTFNITGLLDRFAKSLQGAVEWFAKLDDGTKRVIIQTGLFLVTLGPAIKVFGTLSRLLGENVALLRALTSATKTTVLFFAGMTESTKSVTGYVKEFATNMLGAGQAALKMRVAIIAATGGIAAIVLGIAAAVTFMADKFDAAAFAEEQFAKAKKETISIVAKETAELNKNFDILKNVNSSTEDKKKSIDALNAIYPSYLKGLDLEKASATELTKIQTRLNDQILRGVAERQKAAAVTAIYEKQAELLLKVQKIRRTGKAESEDIAALSATDLRLSEGFSPHLAAMRKMQEQIQSLGEQVNVTAKDFDKAFGLQSRAIDLSVQAEYKQRAAYYESKEAAEDLLKTKKKIPPTEEEIIAAQERALAKSKEVAAANKAAADEERKRFEALRDFWSNPIDIKVAPVAVPTLPQAQSGLPAAQENAPTFESPSLGALNDGLTAINSLTSAVNAYNTAAGLGVQASVGFSEALGVAFEGFEKGGTFAAAVTDAMLASVQNLAQQGSTSLLAYARAAVSAGLQVAKAAAVEGVFTAVKSALRLPFPINIAAAALAAGATAALFNGLTNRITAPALAHGGVVDKPTLALIGEYPGASSNPEIVTPENKLRSIFRENSQGANGELVARVSGGDLLFILDKAANRRGRIR